MPGLARILVLGFGLLLAGPRTFAAVTLDGRFEHRSDEQGLEMLGDSVCFHPGEESAKLLPRPLLRVRTTWFCFRNTAQAKQLLGTPGSISEVAPCGLAGFARIRAENYVPYLGEGDGFDTADLKAVISTNKASVLPCN